MVHFCLNHASFISFGQYDENVLGNKISKFGDGHPIISGKFHDFENGHYISHNYIKNRFSHNFVASVIHFQNS